MTSSELGSDGSMKVRSFLTPRSASLCIVAVSFLADICEERDEKSVK